MKTFYRIANPTTYQGLWYNFNGEFTGLIHTKYNFCTNSSLEMDFDPTIVGWLSVADSIDNLLQWFSKKDIDKLKEHDYEICVYESNDYKWYDRFSHYVINQENSKLVAIIELDEEIV